MTNNEIAALMQSGAARYRAKEFDAAIADFTAAIGGVPNNAVAWYNRGCAYYGKGDRGRALADWEQAAALAPDNAKYREMLKKARGAAGNGKPAVPPPVRQDVANTAHADGGTFKIDAEAYVDRGNDFLGNGDYNAAIADFGEAIRLDPNCAVAYFRRGCVYGSQKDISRAFADFEMAVKLVPDNNDYRKAFEMVKADMNSKYNRPFAMAKPEKTNRIVPDGYAYNEQGDRTRNAAMSLNFRIIGKLAFLLVIIGFFMPVACDMNGFQLANNIDKTNATFLYGLFILAFVGFVIGVLLLMKKKVPVVIDWLIVLGCTGIGLSLLRKNELKLQSGAYVIGTGCITALIAQFITLIGRKGAEEDRV